MNQVYLLHVSATRMAILRELHYKAIFSNGSQWLKHVGEILYS